MVGTMKFPELHSLLLSTHVRTRLTNSKALKVTVYCSIVFPTAIKYVALLALPEGVFALNLFSR